MQEGETITWDRTFTEEDVRTFGQISGDQGEHHMTPDEQGRLMVQGLLTATLPAKIGGDINFIARELNFEFHLPVYAGDTIHCEVMVTLLEHNEGAPWTHLHCKWVCTNQEDKQVMTGRARGVVRNQ